MIINPVGINIKNNILKKLKVKPRINSNKPN
jgi:hypothetical protein